MRAIYNKYRILRIRPRLHYTWFFAVILITVAVVTQFSPVYPLSHRVFAGLGASVLFFIAVNTREFTLSFVATRKGIVAESVTLFAFGGLSNIDRDTSTPALEFLLATLGALLNTIIAGIFSVVYFFLMQRGGILVDVLVQWLAFIWFMLALFHIVPGFPLDGGRALRALLWKLTGDYERSTRIASWVGWGIGLVLTIGGIVLLIIPQEWFTGIFIIAIGLVLQNAATHSRRQIRPRTVMNTQQRDG